MALRLRAIGVLLAGATLLLAGCQKDLDETAYDFACSGNGDCHGDWECLPSAEYDTKICQPPGTQVPDVGDASDSGDDASDTPGSDADADMDAADADDVPDAAPDTCTETEGGVERCDGVDNDCDGEVDEGLGFEAVELVAGENHVCAIGDAGDVFCWGDNTDGKAQPGTAAARPDVVRRPTVNTLLEISVTEGLALALGDDHSCLLQDQRQISCWGSGDNGRLGPGSPVSGTVNTFGADDIPALEGASQTLDQIDAGDSFTCVRNEDADVFCWGSQDSYRYSDTEFTGESATPIEFVEMSFPTDLFALGDAHGCAITGTDDAVVNEAETDVYCWGDAANGKTGKDASDDHPPERMLASFAAGPDPFQYGLRVLELGGTISCGFNGSELLCWGSNGAGQLAQPEDTDQSSDPVTVDLPGDAEVRVGSPKGLTAGFAHVCVLDLDFNARCWGAGAEGQLGHGESGTGVEERTPVNVLGDRTFSQLAAGRDFTCGIEGDAPDGTPGQVYCWGNNRQHQLGLGPDGDGENSFDAPQPVACAFDDDGG